MKVVVLFADGFEEIEAVTPVDVLRRAGADVQMLSITDILRVTGAHGIKILADGILTGDEDVDAVVLPGGLPGAINLSENEKVLKLVRAQYEKAGVVAAICAAPIVLDLWYSTSSFNDANYNNPAYDALIDEVKASSDQKLRFEKMREAEKMLMADMPVAPVYFYTLPYMVKPNIEGVYKTLLNYPTLTYAEIK